MGVEAVIARDMKSFAGYFLGLMKEKEDQVDGNKAEDYVVGLGSRTMCIEKQFFTRCKVLGLSKYLHSRACHHTFSLA